MLDTLQKMSGTTHKSFTDSKTITRDMERIWMQNEGKASYTMTTREVPVISYNDMAFIAERNSIVFRAGDAPIWNRNETILPMSWRLFKNTIEHPGHEYSLQTIPTLSSALDFDVRQNQPNFQKILNKRMAQALVAEECMAKYQEAYGYDDYEIEKLDIDVYSDEIMSIINEHISNTNEAEAYDEDDDWDYDVQYEEDYFSEAEDNTKAQQEAIADAKAKYESSDEKIYAGGMLSPNDLLPAPKERVSRQYDKYLINAYVNVKGDMERDTSYFQVINGELCGSDGTIYIRRNDESDSLRELNQQAKEDSSRVFGEGKVSAKELSSYASYEITDDFIRFLATQNSWSFANGRFDEEVHRQMMDQ